MICRWLAMYIRCVVAVMDFNANVSRPVKQVEGNIQYKMKVHIKLILKRGSPAVDVNVYFGFEVCGGGGGLAEKSFLRGKWDRKSVILTNFLKHIWVKV